MDYSAIGIRVMSYVGDNGTPVDITDYVQDAGAIKTSAIDLTVGYVKTELTILLVDQFRTFLDSDDNPRWALESKIEIYVRQSTGSEVLHRTLRILDQWFDDGTHEDSTEIGIHSLELELGDLFALRDRLAPHPGDIDIPILANTIDVLITTTLNYWLRTFGFTDIVFLPGERVPPERITTTGLYSANDSIVEHLGKICANARSVLWIDPQERVRLRYIGFEATTTNYTWQNNTQRVQFYKTFPDTLSKTIPNSAISYDLVPDQMLINRRSRSEKERVSGTVQVTGVSLYRYPYTDPPAETTVRTVGGATFTEVFEVETNTTTRTTTKTGTLRILGVNANAPGTQTDLGNYEEIEEEVYGGGFPEIPNTNPALPPYPGMDPWLLSKTLTLREQRPTGGGSSVGLGAMSQTKQVVTQYSYRQVSSFVKGVLIRGVEPVDFVEVTRTTPTGQSSGSGVGGGSTINMGADQTRTVRYHKLSENLWLTTEEIVRPKDTENRRITQSYSNAPPSVTFRPPLITEENKEIYAEIQINYPVGAKQSRDVKTYNVGAYLDNNKFAKLLVEALSFMLVGRNRAQQMAFRPSDEWLADPIPGFWVQTESSPGFANLYLADVPVLTLAEDSTYLGCSGIYFGQRSLTTGAVTPAYGVPQSTVGIGTTKIGIGNIAIAELV